MMKTDKQGEDRQTDEKPDGRVVKGWRDLQERTRRHTGGGEEMRKGEKQGVTGGVLEESTHSSH